MALNIPMKESKNRQQRSLSLIEWAGRAAELYEGFAESMHDVADHLVSIDPILAAKFYQAADLTRIEVAHLREIIPRQAKANCILLALGVVIGLMLHWLVGLIL